MAMSTMYPKFSTKTDGDNIIMEQKLLAKVSHLVLKKNVCTGCGICSEACPKEAIVLGLVGAVRRGAVTTEAPISVDPAKCSYCGVCVILCPFNALGLEVDGEPSLPILEQEGFPQYDITAEIDESKCNRCTICHEVCPNDAIIRDVPTFEGVDAADGGKRQAALTGKTTFVVDKEKCTVCGICAALCPALSVDRIPFYAETAKSLGDIVWDEKLCNACQVCALACPTEAIKVERAVESNKLPGKVTIDVENCCTCSWCEKTCPTEAVTIKKFFDGEISFNAEKCPAGCSTCVEVCPCNAIYLPSPASAVGMKKQKEAVIAVNKDLCIFCGACVNACPSEDVIRLKRTEIRVKGPETDLFKKIAEKLYVPRTSKVRETSGHVEVKKVE